MGVIVVTTTAKPLDRRRDKAGATGAAAEKARAAVTDLDNQLKTIAGLTEEQQLSLRRATDEAARLKRSLKAAGKRRAELTKQRKKAVARAEKAKERARAAEAKYDKELLADMVRREKERDRNQTANS
jgi:chromosome segregation ATPase